MPNALRNDTSPIDARAPERSAYPGAGYAMYVIAIFFLAAILSYTDRLVLNLLVDPIRQDLQITDTEISLLQGAAFAVLYACIGLPLGVLADRHNRRNLILFGVIVWSAATAACGFATSFGELFIARIVVGLGEAALAPAAMSMIPDYFPPNRRGTAIGIFITGMAMGGGAAIVIGGALLQAFQSGQLALPAFLGTLTPWRSVLLALSLPGCLLAALLVTVREPVRQETLAATTNDGAPSGFRRTLEYFSENRWTFICLFTAFAFANLVSYGVESWLPSVLIRQFGLSPAEVGASIGAVLLVCRGGGTIAGGLLYDRLQRTDRLDAGLRFALIASVAALPLLVFPLLPMFAALLALGGVYAFLTGIAGTAGLTAIQDAVPGEMRGFAVSLQGFMYTLVGLGLGPTLVAFTTDHIYRDPKSVGASIVAISLPASLISAGFLWAALRGYRVTRARLIGTEPEIGAAPKPRADALGTTPTQSAAS